MAVGARYNRTLAFAIGLSAVVHVLVLFGPAWQVPTEQATVLPPLDARLTPLPRPTLTNPDDKRPLLGDAPPPRPRPRPRKPAPPAEAVASAAPSATLAPEPDSGGDGKAPDAPPQDAGAEQAAASSEGQGGREGTPDSKPPGPGPADLWAASGKIQYNVIRGEQNFVIGRTTHAWSHDREHYSMETVIETSGLIGLLKPFRMVQRSEGRIGPRGLQPEKFTVERDGKLKERADFDWSTAQVVLVAGERRREFSLAEGDQDVLSLMHHLSLQPEGPMRVELLVVTGKSAVRSVIENLGIEEIEVPAGRVSAYHLGSSGHRGELKIDIWLARDYANLPVRLKITDKSGDVLDQVATGVDLGQRAAPR
ncbi:DUF3108 domain-containing protein [Zoogloea dura]|jgi:hypothetical protein|uniref:DUF3108 domain-containing protein n=1 Tax=Zoogloea dura TaxID=2728840 RepID=A0A848G3Y0_9RHOO|nr:DUF3108 domain-containing protein [Zoogloea dura]NML25964.1 DUF3108 domain-containing protein [Zoogloea dura]